MKQWFYTVSGTYHRLKRSNLPIKSQAFLTGTLSCVGVALNFNSFCRNGVTTFPWPSCFKSNDVSFRDSSAKYQNSFACLRKMCLMELWKRTFYRNDDFSKPCQCRQLQLNPSPTQINIYCLMTNQTPALLVQHAPWTRAAVMLLQSLYFSRPPPPRATCIISDVRPLGHLKIKMAAINYKTRYITTVISRKNRGQWTVYFGQHPLSTPESFVDCRLRYRSWTSRIWSSIRRGAGRQKPWRFA